MDRLRRQVSSLLIATALLARPCGALINPSLQVLHLCQRYTTVARFTIGEVDEDRSVATLTLKAVAKGECKATAVTLSAPDPNLADVFFDLITQGETLVAFIGKTRRGEAVHEVLFYAGSGRWQVAVVDDPAKPGAWRWTQDLKDAYFGTFNGRADRLFEMTQDYGTGRYYFPATPFARFRPDLPVGKLSGPARGVALHDVDGDGDLDIYACSPAGNRMYVQTRPMQFEDRTDALGLDGVASGSVGVADVNGDGRADLLAGGTILLAGADGRFRRADLLPPAAQADLKMAFFAEINGDGFPDVVMSVRNGGLRVFLNKAAAPLAMAEATGKCGLKAPAAGAGATGYAFAGDWNADGRTDLFHAVNGGLILVQDKDGRFSHHDRDLGYEFTSVDGEAGACGGGAFAPLWRPDAYDIITTQDTEALHLFHEAGHAREMNGYGNEITEGTRAMLAALAEDLNADGTTDVYVTTRSANPNIFFANRGYGSFMASHKYDRTIFTGKAHQQGAWGAAAGDVDGDGTIDLCLTGSDGSVTLMMNDARRLRQPKENMLHHERLRANAGYVTIAPGGRRGVLGAEIRLIDDGGRIVSRRTLGSNVMTGCRGPDAATFAVLWPGSHTALVRFSDGTKRQAAVAVRTGQHTRLGIARGD